MGRRGRRPHPDILTPREWQVLDLLRERLTNEQIAEQLGITLDGAKYHLSEILSKIGAPSREEAARWSPTEMRPAWMRLMAMPIAAKAAGVLTLTATAGGLAVLAWGVAETGGPAEEQLGAANATQTPKAASSPTATHTPEQAPSPGLPFPTTIPTPIPIEGGRFEGVTMKFDAPDGWFFVESSRPYFDSIQGTENIVLQNFPPSAHGTEWLSPGSIKMDFSAFQLSVAATPVIDAGYEDLAIANPSGAGFLLGKWERGWHVWGLAEFGGYFFFVSVLMATDEPAVEVVEPILASWELSVPE